MRVFNISQIVKFSVSIFKYDVTLDVFIHVYLHPAPIHWAQSDETESLYSRVGSHSVTVLALLCTDPQSSWMSLDKYLRRAEQSRGNMISYHICND